MTNVSEKIKASIRIVTNDTFTIAVLMAVLAVCVLAFVFGADYELIMFLLFLGAVTAFVEARMRTKTPK